MHDTILTNLRRFWRQIAYKYARDRSANYKDHVHRRHAEQSLSDILPS